MIERITPELSARNHVGGVEAGGIVHVNVQTRQRKLRSKVVPRFSRPYQEIDKGVFLYTRRNNTWITKVHY